MSVAARTQVIAGEAEMRPATSLWRDAARRFGKNKLAVGALVVMALLVLAAVFADVIAPAPYDYSVLADANQFPNPQHLLGTERLVEAADCDLGCCPGHDQRAKKASVMK